MNKSSDLRKFRVIAIQLSYLSFAWLTIVAIKFTGNAPEADTLQVGTVESSLVSILPINVEQNSYTSNVPQGTIILSDQSFMSQFKTGTTLTGYSLDSYGNSSAIASGKQLMYDSTDVVVQHVHGFGVSFALQQNGTYDWTSLDRRFNTILGSADTPVLTACCAPKWMEVSNGGDTGDFSPYLPPKPEYYDEYAEAVKQALIRYPHITHVQVWNEMKGFWDPTAYNGKGGWDYTAYTNLYNTIFDTVKASKPSVMVGGPYVVVSSSAKSGRWYNSQELKGAWGWADQRAVDVLKYWLQNKHGADFVALDAKNHRDYSDVTSGSPEMLTSPFDQNQKFADINNWIRSLDNQTYLGAASLPLWYAEWYSRMNVPDDTLGIAQQINQGSMEQRNAVMTHGLIQHIKGGTATAIQWGPQGEDSTDGWMQPLATFTNTRVPGGGQATLFYQSQKYIHDYFSQGANIVASENANPDIEAIATSSKILAVNETASTQSTTVLGASINLQPYEVKLFNTPTPNPDDPVAPPPSGNDPVVSNPANNPAATGSNDADGLAGSGTTESSQKEEKTTSPVQNIKEIRKTFSTAFYSDAPISIAGVKFNARPLRYIAFAVFVTSSVASIVIERKHIIGHTFAFRSYLAGKLFHSPRSI